MSFYPAALPSLGEAIRRALALDSSIFVAVQREPAGLWVALAVVLLAGLSEALGQSVVLFINRVRPHRFVLSVVISAFTYSVGYLLWSTSVWLVGVYGFGRSESWWSVAAVVGLAYAPQVLAFFELTPVIGNPFAVLLTLWSMLAIVVAVRAGFNLLTWQAIIASGLGWVLILAWRRTLGRPVYALGQWLERRASGSPLAYSRRDIWRLRRTPHVLKNWDEWRTRSVAGNGATDGATRDDARAGLSGKS
jgi:hypothetical protein